MLVKTYCAAVNGLEVTTVTVEVSLNRGVMYHLTGLGDEAVKESRNRISAALQYSGFKFPIADITINLAPADLRKEGSSFDLPLAIGLLGANNNIPEDHLKEYMMVGELSLHLADVLLEVYGDAVADIRVSKDCQNGFGYNTYTKCLRTSYRRLL